MRPRSATLLPVTITSTGLLCLLVGACVHRVRRHTEKYYVWLLLCAHHFQCMTHITLIECNGLESNEICTFLDLYSEI